MSVTKISTVATLLKTIGISQKEHGIYGVFIFLDILLD